MEIKDLIQGRPAGRSRQASWYRALIEAADELGLSTAELAEYSGCSVGTIYNWKRRLAGASAQPRTTTPDTARLVQVQVAPASTSAPRPSSFELRLAHGRSVIVPSQFDQAALVSLIKVLEQC